MIDIFNNGFRNCLNLCQTNNCKEINFIVIILLIAAKANAAAQCCGLLIIPYGLNCRPSFR